MHEIFRCLVLPSGGRALRTGWACGLQGAAQTASAILRTDGIRGLYRGFGTVIFGTIPARGVMFKLLLYQ